MTERMERPKIAVVDSNTLAVMGMKQMLQSVIPIMRVETFGSFEELEESSPDSFFHYFVACPRRSMPRFSPTGRLMC